MLAVGAVAPVVCLLWWRRLAAIEPPAPFGLTTSCAPPGADVRPLPVPVIEQLAHGLHRTQLRPGEAVFEQGDIGDSFYVVADGTVKCSTATRAFAPWEGEGFGEIALFGDTGGQ